MSQVSQHLSGLSGLEGRWSLDPERTTVEFHTKIMRVVPVRGTIKAIEGRAIVGTDGIVDGTLILDIATIDTGIKKRDIHLRSADFFDADSFPRIIFAAQSARRYPSGRIEVAGSLTLHGETQPLTTFVEIQLGSTDAILSANIEMDRTAWGIGRTRPGLSTSARVEVTAHFVRE
jgi:polyisoprenoid-binding protein YceI